MFGRDKKEKTEDPKKEKVAFGDRKLVVWAKENAPDLVGGLIEATGTVLQLEGLKQLGEKISGSNELTPEQKEQAFELYKIDLEIYKAENEDRASARNREIEIAKTGRTDWMMYLTGFIGLCAFVFMAVCIIFVPSVQENLLAHQLLGVIEGVALSVFGYYFGSSKGSSDKTKLLKS